MKGRYFMNTTTGLAAAFSLKTILTAVISVGVAAVVTVGGYAVASNYILFPEFGEALENTLEAKTEPLTEFDTKKFAEEGKTEVKVEIPKLDLDASLSLSHSEKALQVALKTCGETLTLSKKDMNVAVALDGFKEGEAYGLSLKNLRKQIMNSIFAADSGTDYEIDMGTINQICDVVETFTEPKEVSEEYERAYAFLTKVFEKSEMAKEAQISYSKLEVLGEERSGRSQTLTINQYYLVSLLEDYAEAFDNLKGKDLEAVEYVLEDIEEAFSPEESINVDDVAEKFEEAAEALEQLEGLDDVEITYSVCYVEKYLSAVVLGVECKVDEADVDIEGTITVDFGEKPHKTRETIINVDLEGKVEGESAEIVAEVTLDSEKDGDVITYSAELDVEMAIPTLGEENPFNGTVLSGKVEMVLDAGKEEAVITASYDRNEETVDLFTMEFEYSDSKDKLSVTPKKVTALGEEFEIPVDVTVSLYREPDKIKANKYTNVLEMSEKEFEKLGEDLEKYLEELEQDIEDWLSALDDLEGAIDDLENIAGIGGSANEDVLVPDFDSHYGIGY